MEATKCALCSRELRGAIETRYVSMRRVVMITMIETADCNWKRCVKCNKAVCKSCFMSLALCCLDCFTERDKESAPSVIRRNGHVSTNVEDNAPRPNPD
jgi:hypothetical protein